MHSLARSPHFTVNPTNNRIVLNTTVLSCHSEIRSNSSTQCHTAVSEWVKWLPFRSC